MFGEIWAGNFFSAKLSRKFYALKNKKNKLAPSKLQVGFEVFFLSFFCAR